MGYIEFGIILEKKQYEKCPNSASKLFLKKVLAIKLLQSAVVTVIVFGHRLTIFFRIFDDIYADRTALLSRHPIPVHTLSQLKVKIKHYIFAFAHSNV